MVHSGKKYSLPFALLVFTLRHKMTDSVLSIPGCFVRLRVPAVFLAAPNNGTAGQHLEELAGSLPRCAGSSSLPKRHLDGESRGRASWRDKLGESRRAERKRQRGEGCGGGVRRNKRLLYSRPVTVFLGTIVCGWIRAEMATGAG